MFDWLVRPACGGLSFLVPARKPTSARRWWRCSRTSARPARQPQADSGLARRPNVTRPTPDIARSLRRQLCVKSDGPSGCSAAPSWMQDHLAPALHKVLKIYRDQWRVVKVGIRRSDGILRCRAPCHQGARHPADQMSRKRPGSPVTCRFWWLKVADLRVWSFGCFRVVPVDAAESPRKVPEGSHGPRTTFRFYST